MITCRNCSTVYEGNYCPNCGQSKKQKRVNQRDLLYDTQHFLHLDNSLFYTSAQLLRKPGNTIRDYIDGKRVKHYKPISMVLMIGGVYGLVFHFTKLIPFNIFIQSIYFFNELIHGDSLIFPEWALKNYAIIEVLFFLPVFTIISYFAFYNAKLTFYEHIVVNSYISSGRLLIGIITLPLLVVFRNSSYVLFMEIFINSTEVAFTFWSFIVFYSYVKPEKSIQLTALTFLIVFTIIFLVVWLF